MADLVSGSDDFQLSVNVNMAVVCFRFVPGGVDAESLNRLNQSIVEHVNASGKAFLTYTTLRGQTCIRAGFGNLLTTDQHIHAVWDQIRSSARAAMSNQR